MEVYIKGKFEFGIGSAAYVVVDGEKEVTHGFGALNDSFAVDKRLFACDQFNVEVLAAICGVARCSGKSVRVFSNNKCVVSWLSKGGEPDGRRELLDIWRAKTAAMDVSVEYIPHCDKDASLNPWNRRCNDLAMAALRG